MPRFAARASEWGKVVPVVYGQHRIAPGNLIWYGDFSKVPCKRPPA